MITLRKCSEVSGSLRKSKEQNDVSTRKIIHKWTQVSASGRIYPYRPHLFPYILFKKLVTGRDPWESAEKMTFLDATPDAEHYVTGA